MKNRSYNTDLNRVLQCLSESVEKPIDKNELIERLNWRFTVEYNDHDIRLFTDKLITDGYVGFKTLERENTTWNQRLYWIKLHGLEFFKNGGYNSNWWTDFYHRFKEPLLVVLGALISFATTVGAEYLKQKPEQYQKECVCPQSQKANCPAKAEIDE